MNNPRRGTVRGTRMPLRHEPSDQLHCHKDQKTNRTHHNITDQLAPKSTFRIEANRVAVILFTRGEATAVAWHYRVCFIVFSISSNNFRPRWISLIPTQIAAPTAAMRIIPKTDNNASASRSVPPGFWPIPPLIIDAMLINPNPTTTSVAKPPRIITASTTKRELRVAFSMVDSFGSFVTLLQSGQVTTVPGRAFSRLNTAWQLGHSHRGMIRVPRVELAATANAAKVDLITETVVYTLPRTFGTGMPGEPTPMLTRLKVQQRANAVEVYSNTRMNAVCVCLAAYGNAPCKRQVEPSRLSRPPPSGAKLRAQKETASVLPLTV